MDPTQLLRNAIVLVNARHSILEPQLRELERRGAIVHVYDTNQLEASQRAVRDVMNARGSDFVLFAQNDQVLERQEIGETIRALGCGYSSFSGIDDNQYREQTLSCLQDLVTGRGTVVLSEGKMISQRAPSSRPSFSFVFDTEQMGGVRFGLPRILSLLDRHSVPATFFLTGFVAQMYPELVPALRSRGHSIGVHSRYHEYLSNLPLEAQIQRLILERHLLGQPDRVKGANLIFRMNGTTVRALVHAGFDYFVTSMEHTFAPFAYRELPVHPYPIWTAEGSIWMVPVSVETYDRNDRAVWLSVDSARRLAKREAAPTVSILMHPFRDGRSAQLGALEKLTERLKDQIAMSPKTLDQVIERMPAPSPTAFIYVDIGDGAMAGQNVLPRGGLERWHWDDRAKYWQRVDRVYRSLRNLGHEPALCIARPQEGPVYAVHPYLPEDAPHQQVPLDPLSAREEMLRSHLQHYAERGDSSVLAFGPSQRLDTLRSVCRSVIPKQPADWAGIPIETGSRLMARIARCRLAEPL